MAAYILKRQGGDRRLVVERLDVEDEGLDQALRRHHLEVFTLERHVLTSGGVLDEPPPTPWADVHLLDGGGVAVWPPTSW